MDCHQCGPCHWGWAGRWDGCVNRPKRHGQTRRRPHATRRRQRRPVVPRYHTSSRRRRRRWRWWRWMTFVGIGGRWVEVVVAVDPERWADDQGGSTTTTRPMSLPLASSLPGFVLAFHRLVGPENNDLSSSCSHPRSTHTKRREVKMFAVVGKQQPTVKIR